jgi:acetyl-CoA C-acetyltransferase
MSNAVVITGYARTPMGSFQGALAAMKSTELGAAAVRAAVAGAGVAPESVERI